MKKYFLFTVLSFLIFITACTKKDTACSLTDVNVTASATEIASIQNYLTTNGLTATQHSSGFFYKITAAGSGAIIANLCSNITVKYTGKLTNGTVFDQTAAGATATFKLGQLIVGWQKGLPLISSGGKITLYIPPSLGYGSNAAGAVPANSILIFDIELVGVS